jgi:cytochrome c-type biogenesis protein CcmH/NrfF
MTSSRRACVLTFVLPLASALLAQEPAGIDLPPLEQDAGMAAGHGEPAKPYDPRDFTTPERERIELLFQQVMCKCPREDWSKTLAGCPDGCAEQQKAEIRAAVKAGKKDDQIIAEQVGRYGREARARPDSLLAHWGPYLALAACGILALLALSRALRPAKPVPEAVSVAAAPPAETVTASEDERRLEEEVERDLREMDV